MPGKTFAKKGCHKPDKGLEQHEHRVGILARIFPCYCCLLKKHKRLTSPSRFPAVLYSIILILVVRGYELISPPVKVEAELDSLTFHNSTAAIAIRTKAIFNGFAINYMPRQKNDNTARNLF
jgi:hypothetical protein